MELDNKIVDHLTFGIIAWIYRIGYFTLTDILKTLGWSPFVVSDSLVKSFLDKRLFKCSDFYVEDFILNPVNHTKFLEEVKVVAADLYNWYNDLKTRAKKYSIEIYELCDKDNNIKPMTNPRIVYGDTRTSVINSLFHTLMAFTSNFENPWNVENGDILEDKLNEMWYTNSADMFAIVPGEFGVKWGKTKCVYDKEEKKKL